MRASKIGPRFRLEKAVERYPSGQRDQTVNLAAFAFEGSNPSLSTIFSFPSHLGWDKAD